MKIALITNHNNYCGREYALALDKENIKYDILIMGENPVHNEKEDERCGNMWFPKVIDLNRDNVYRFKSLKSEDF